MCLYLSIPSTVMFVYSLRSNRLRMESHGYPQSCSGSFTWQSLLPEQDTFCAQQRETTKHTARKMDRNVLSVRASQRLASLHRTHPSICFLSIVRVPCTSGKRLLPSLPLLSSLCAIVDVPGCWLLGVKSSFLFALSHFMPLR